MKGWVHYFFESRFLPTISSMPIKGAYALIIFAITHASWQWPDIKLFYLVIDSNYSLTSIVIYRAYLPHSRCTTCKMIQLIVTKAPLRIIFNTLASFVLKGNPLIQGSSPSDYTSGLENQDHHLFAQKSYRYLYCSTEDVETINSRRFVTIPT